MRSSLLLIAFLFFGAAISFSQENRPLQLIYLTDGSFIKGVILEEGDSTAQTTQIRLTDGSVIELSKDLVWNVGEVKSEEILLPSGRKLLKKGWYSAVAVHSLTAHRSSEFDDDLRWGFGAHFSSGFQFNPFLKVGAGLGLDAHEYLFAPVFLEFSGFLIGYKSLFDSQANRLNSKNGKAGIPRKLPLFYSLQLGYNIPVAELFGSDDNDFEKTEGGRLVYPAVGFIFPSRSGANFRLDIGYKFQRFTRVYEPNWWNSWTTKDHVRLKSFAVRLGWVF